MGAAASSWPLRVLLVVGLFGPLAVPWALGGGAFAGAVSLVLAGAALVAVARLRSGDRRAALAEAARERVLAQEATAQLERAKAERDQAAAARVELEARVKELEAATTRAEAGTKARGEFLAMMSHEIRTPLNGILGTTDLLEESRLDDDQRQLVRLVRRSGQLLLTVINDILDFSKIEAGRLELFTRRCELARELNDQLGLLRPLAAEHGVTLTSEIAPGVPAAVSLDGTRLSQVVGNLVGNAVKFTRHGSITVKVHAEPDGAGLRLFLAVTDTGVGISPEAVPHLFQPFSQVDGGRTGRYGGSGLGLAICARLVRLMGGSISVDSVLGKGTTFRFDVRCEVLEDAQPLSSTSPIPAPAPATEEELLVLLVEDNAVNQVIGQQMLVSLGCTVDIATNGQEAVEMVLRGRYDLVLMDLKMPVMDGITATRLICERLGARRPRIVAVTANAFASDRDACLAAGMDDFEAKPLLLERLRRHVGLARPRRDAPA